jgi:hypothetical protein
MECCARCIAYGFEVAMDEDKIRKGFYQGSQFVDFAFRDGIVSGLDKAIWHLKRTKAAHHFGKENRASLELAINYLLQRVADELEFSNEWLQEEDPNNQKLKSIWIKEHKHG